MSEEIWRDVPGHEGLYAVSTHGRITSHRNGLMHPYINGDGYETLALSRSGVRTQTYLHHLVAATFHGPRPPGLQVRHLDGDPGNSRPDNLAYGTQSDNEKDKLVHGRNINARKTHCDRGHEFTPENTYVYRPGRRECRACTRITAASGLVERQARLASDPTIAPHGRESTYSGWGCRCAPCRSAHNAGEKARRDRRIVRKRVAA